MDVGMQRPDLRTVGIDRASDIANAVATDHADLIDRARLTLTADRLYSLAAVPLVAGTLIALAVSLATSTLQGWPWMAAGIAVYIVMAAAYPFVEHRGSTAFDELHTIVAVEYGGTLTGITRRGLRIEA